MSTGRAIRLECISVACKLVALIALGLFATQGEENFKARLSPVPIDMAMRNSVTGSGSVSAALAGAKLTVKGSFEGLRSPAIAAQLHQGRVTGIRGPAVFDLTFTKATSGALTGSFDLSAEQVESLKKGRFYIQIDSEKAPEGNLWGWLLR